MCFYFVLLLYFCHNCVVHNPKVQYFKIFEPVKNIFYVIKKTKNILALILTFFYFFPRRGNSPCNCVPFLEKIGKRMEEDRRQIIGHINQRSTRLDSRLDLLETKTKNQIFNFHQTMKARAHNNTVHCQTNSFSPFRNFSLRTLSHE